MQIWKQALPHIRTLEETSFISLSGVWSSAYCRKFFSQSYFLPFNEVPLFKWNFTVTTFWLPGHAGDSSIEAANADASDTTL